MWREHRRHQKRQKDGREIRALMQLRRLRDRDPQLQFHHVDGFKYFVRYGNHGASYWPRTGATIFEGRAMATHYLNVSQLVGQLKGAQR